MVTPNMWNYIGTTAPIDVPVGDTLRVTSALVWPKATLPATGDHACFIALLDQASDPAPPVPAAGPSFDWGAFVNFVRNQNNVTWRNFDVVDVLPDPSADPSVMDFLITGSPDAARDFDFEIGSRVPLNVKIELEIPKALMAMLPKADWKSRRLNERAGIVRLGVPFLRSFSLCGIRLGAASRHQCRFIVHGNRGFSAGLHKLWIRQLYDNVEVGRVTWALRARKQRR